jgi:hypothetical protein
MYLNNYSVRISGHKESGQYVTLNHKEQYTVILGNKSAARCDAEVKIDGRLIGTWRLGVSETLVLERPSNDDGKFTFYRTGSEEAVKVGEHTVGASEKGLIYVTFVPEKLSNSFTFSSDPPVHWLSTDNVVVTDTLQYQNDSVTNTPACYTARSSTTTAGDVHFTNVSSSNTRSAGVTGLSGASNQKFVDAYNMDLDYSKQTVIALRLVAASDDPRPLVAYSTPIPPPI